MVVEYTCIPRREDIAKNEIDQLQHEENDLFYDRESKCFTGFDAAQTEMNRNEEEYRVALESRDEEIAADLSIYNICNVGIPLPKVY